MLVSAKLVPIVVMVILSFFLGLLLHATKKQGEKIDHLLRLIYQSELEGKLWSDREQYHYSLESLEEQGYVTSEEDPTNDDTTEIPHRIYQLTELGRERVRDLPPLPTA